MTVDLEERKPGQVWFFSRQGSLTLFLLVEYLGSYADSVVELDERWHAFVYRFGSGSLSGQSLEEIQFTSVNANNWELVCDA